MKKLITSIILVILVSEVLFANISCAASTWDEAFENVSSLGTDTIELTVRKCWSNPEC